MIIWRLTKFGFFFSFFSFLLCRKVWDIFSFSVQAFLGRSYHTARVGNSQVPVSNVDFENCLLREWTSAAPALACVRGVLPCAGGVLIVAMLGPILPPRLDLPKVKIVITIP